MQAEHTSPAVRRSGRLAGKGADDPPPLPRKRGGGGSGGGGGGGQQRRLPHGLPHKELLAAAKHLTDSTGMAKAKAEEALIEAARRGAHVWQDWDRWAPKRSYAAQRCHPAERGQQPPQLQSCLGSAAAWPHEAAARSPVPSPIPPIPSQRRRWMDEAQLWVAQAQEAAEEERKLREAMAASLADRDRAGQREAGPPLVNQSEERLRQKFQGSAVLGAVRAWENARARVQCARVTCAGEGPQPSDSSALPLPNTRNRPPPPVTCPPPFCAAGRCAAAKPAVLRRPQARCGAAAAAGGALRGVVSGLALFF